MVYKIGLTGNIGCGKSVVGDMLQELGAEYVDADRVVHGLLAAGSPLADGVIARFGPEVRADDGGVDRPRLGAVVFADPNALRDLEQLLHPAVRIELRRRMAECTAPAIVIDAIKLIENGLHEEVDSVWVVTCTPEDQRRRLATLRGMSLADAETRISAQPPQEEKLPFANVVIDNSGSLEATRQQVEVAWNSVPAPGEREHQSRSS